MFNFFKTPFATYYSKITALPVVKTCRYYEPFTAAYLYIISDFCLGSNYNKRRENSGYIYGFLDDQGYSDAEMDLFDDAVELFAQIINKEIEPRGDWVLFGGQRDNPFDNLFLCYGDLIRTPEYIEDYENCPITIQGFDEVMSFAEDFNEILTLTAKYVKSL